MALSAVQTAMNPDGESLHPFFSKPSGTPTIGRQVHCAPGDAESFLISDEGLRTIKENETPVDHAHHDTNSADTSPPSGKEPKRKPRKTEGVKDIKLNVGAIKGQTSLKRFARPLRPLESASAYTNIDHAIAESSLEEDPNQDRKKRRKTKSPEPPLQSRIAAQSSSGNMDWHRQLQAEAGVAADIELHPKLAPGDATAVGDTMTREGPYGAAEGSLRQDTSPTIALTGHALDVDVTSSNAVVAQHREATPKKQIKVTKSGKLLSSPPKPALELSTSPKKRRGRKPAKPKPSPTITVIRYGSDSDIASRTALGEKIEGILNGKKRSTLRSAPPKKPPSKPVGPPKATHPFFKEKITQQKESLVVKSNDEQRAPVPAPRTSAVTPGKLRAEAQSHRPLGPTPAFGMNSNSTRMAKQAGLNEASWPTKETIHVRNLEGVYHTKHPNHRTDSILAFKPRKLKNNVFAIPTNQDLIAMLAKDLFQDIHREPCWSILDFRPPELVRLPKRVLTTGSHIQERVRAQLGEPLVLIEPIKIKGMHPAVETLFNDIAQTLTPFDEGKCEGQTWAQKYTPKLASHVLYAGSEALVLKDWLQSSTVIAVGGVQSSLKLSTFLDVKKPPKKKRKVVLDDFIVSDDEDEDDEMMEISRDSAQIHSQSLRRPQWTRNKNVVLVSGPHGCGKSAMVHAVAKELGFEVFEIHAGMRRSGKDIQDKVGDMTANHLVNNKRSTAAVLEAAAQTDDTDDELASTALQKDLDSGRQGTMTSFFQLKPAKAKPIITVKPQAMKVPDSAAQSTNPLTSHNSQKQSLILFEEADILFEEDQQFWAQVTKLASHSKRPIVITCNDERQIPLQDLPLAAILRLEPPPVDLATDYLLVLAGREGHVLQRRAISALYESKEHDLRASINELDFWCQMSVGDRKGGLEWMYQRWPPGTDVDENGRVLRVASEGTYAVGMGWLSHNVLETQANTTFDKEEELLKEVWTDWGISPIDWVSSAMTHEPISEPSTTSRLQNLERLDGLAESLSAADVYCRVGLPKYECEHAQTTDASLPTITDKTRLSYTLAAPLLQVDHKSDFLSLDTSISAQTHLLLQRAYPEPYSRAPQVINSKVCTETEYATTLMRLKKEDKICAGLSRPDFSAAFDVLAAPPDHSVLERSSYTLTPSTFDHTFRTITLELAPYVRSIVAHERILESQRLRVSSLLSAGGTAKRARTTRAARTALEGGVRETKRRARWFDQDLNFELVMATAGAAWAGLGWIGTEDGGGGESDEEAGSATSTYENTQDGQDVAMQDMQEEWTRPNLR